MRDEINCGGVVNVTTHQMASRSFPSVGRRSSALVALLRRGVAATTYTIARSERLDLDALPLVLAS
jgi:hypothetical protein